MTKREKINKKISESMREASKPALLKLKNAAEQGMRPKKQYEHAGISEATYYRWLEEDPKLKEELAQKLRDFRKAKIKEAALIGAPATEQRRHANNMTEKEYQDIMNADSEFADEIELARTSNLKLWARKNIAIAIQEGKSIPDSWRILEHLDQDMKRTRIDLGVVDDPENDKLVSEFEEKYKQNLRLKIKKGHKEKNASH